MSYDVLVIGSGAGAAMTALAMASYRANGKAAKRSVCLLQPQPPDRGHEPSANYTFLNPRAAPLLAAMKVRVRDVADGSFTGMAVVDARGGRRAAFRSRSISGYLVNGRRLMRALLAAGRGAGVRLVKTPTDGRIAATDDHVTAEWPGGRCDGRIAVLADLDPGTLKLAEALGLRHRAPPESQVCGYGLTLPASARQIARLGPMARQLTTVWQLASPTLRLRSGSGRGKQWSVPTPDSHAWIMPRKNSVALGMLVQWPENAAGDCPDEQADQLVDGVLDELRRLGVLPQGMTRPANRGADRWRIALASALETESHTGKRTLAVALAGGFSAALSGQWLYPSLQSALLAAGVIDKALRDPRPQDVLSQFDARWRQRLAEYLRRPNTQLSFLLPLVFANQQITDRFCRSYLFGERF